MQRKSRSRKPIKGKSQFHVYVKPEISSTSAEIIKTKKESDFEISSNSQLSLSSFQQYQVGNSTKAIVSTHDRRANFRPNEVKQSGSSQFYANSEVRRGTKTEHPQDDNSFLRLHTKYGEEIEKFISIKNLYFCREKS